MRNWYEAICEDYDIDLLELRKIHDCRISRKSLRGYKKTGKFPKKDPAINAILELVRFKEPSFSLALLEDYFQGKYAQKPTDANKQSCINNIQKALESAGLQGIQFDSSIDSKQPEKIAEWIFDTMLINEGLDTISLFLEDTRIQIKNNDQYVKVRDIHNAIAPLFISDSNAIEISLRQPLAFAGMDTESGAATAATAISRYNGRSQSLTINDKYQFDIPQNAVLVKEFAIEDGELKKQIAGKLSKQYRLSEISRTDEQLYEDIRLKGKIRLKSLNPPFIYLANSHADDGGYPEEQLAEISDFPNTYRFANISSETACVYADETAHLRLQDMYAELHDIEEGLKKITDVRNLVASISEIHNADFKALQKIGEQLNNEDFIDRLEKFSSIFSNTAQGAANIPEAINTGLSLYEKAQSLFTLINEFINA